MAVVSTSRMGVTTSKEMKKSTHNKRDWALKDTPSPILQETRLKLDDRSDFFDYPQMIAEQLATNKVTVQWIGESKNPIEIFTSCDQDVTVGNLIDVLHEMEQPEVAKVLEDWVADP